MLHAHRIGLRVPPFPSCKGLFQMPFAFGLGQPVDFTQMLKGFVGKSQLASSPEMYDVVAKVTNRNEVGQPLNFGRIVEFPDFMQFKVVAFCCTAPARNDRAPIRARPGVRPEA